MRVLVTRPREDAAGFVAALEARGHAAVLEPLLSVVPREPTDWPPGHERTQALLVTSANGLRAFAGADPRRALPVYAVGEASAAAARAAGFRTVFAAAGTVDDLAALVAGHADPAAGPLLHPAAGVLAGDLQGALATQGFAVLRVVLYDARPAVALSPESTRAINEGVIDVVSLFSPRTAATFASLTEAAGLVPACARMAALCLSPNVAAAVADLGWRRVAVAERPDQAALLRALDRLGDRA